VDGGSGLAPSGRVLSSPTVARSIHIPCSHSSSLQLGGSVQERIYASGICMNLLIKDDLPIEELGRYA